MTDGVTLPDEQAPRTDAAQAAAEGALPRFIVRRDDGLHVDLTQFEGSAAFEQLADRLFTAGMYFRGLDYPAFLRLAYDFEPGVVSDTVKACQAAGRAATVRFAAALAHFLPSRIGLYRGVKVTGGEAHYLFEPVSLDFELDAPMYEEDEQGGQRLVGTEKSVVQQKTALDVDEFVAQMWVKGVRFGIDTAEVSRAIAEGFVGRLVAARSLAPSAGHDAGVEELAEGLHRDDKPRVLPDGRVDLAQFSNRFPQVKEGERLMRKIPLEVGALGREVNGRAVAPPMPNDFDLAALAGAGTRIERDGHGEFLIATMDGFLTIDKQTNQVSVMDKIINRDGVSLRTTGDLALTGDEYEEYGEIQEGRAVEGRTITIHADVFGRVVSTGGVITLKHNLMGGAAINHDGPVSIEALASNAFIHAPTGEVTVRRAENCVIVGRRVVIRELATGCDILADELEITAADGCALGARRIAIQLARPRGQTETLVSVLFPDVEAFERTVAGARAELAVLEKDEAQAHADSQALQSEPELAKYLQLATRIHKHELVLTPEQKPAFQRLGERVAPQIRALRALSEEAKVRQARRSALDAHIAELHAGRDDACAGLECRIGKIAGEIIVRTLPLGADVPQLAHLPPAELRARLRSTPPGVSLLCSRASGAFEWCWTAPPA